MLAWDVAGCAGWRWRVRDGSRDPVRYAITPTPMRMPDSTVFSKTDADRILKRAAEIEGAEEARPLTLDELRSIAGEAGFGSQAVERAIAEAKVAGPAEARPQAVQKSGLVVCHLSTARAVPIEISSEQFDLPPRVVPHPMLVPAPVEGGEGRASSGTRATA